MDLFIGNVEERHHGGIDHFSGLQRQAFFEDGGAAVDAFEFDAHFAGRVDDAGLLAAEEITVAHVRDV